MTDDFPAMERREFLRLVAGVAGGAAIAGCERPARRSAPPEERSSDVRINRITSFQVTGERWKHVGRNAQRGDHGRTATDRVVLLETDGGVDGFGSSFASRQQASALLGKDPLSFFANGLVESPLGAGDAPLWDLAGKLLEKPVWELLGAAGPEWVPVYDGSIYFGDLETGNSSTEVDQLLSEVDHSLERGHRAFKIKVGRGHRWMEPEAGLARDVEVVQAIRKRVGRDVRLMVDANNGYTPETARRFLDAAGDEFYFVEELFPENVEADLELGAWLREHGWKTLVADGESAREVDHFVPYIRSAALDVLQGDIRRFGFSRLVRLSRLAEPAGIRLAPHNWGSVLGLYMQLVLGRGIPNFLMAEKDPAETELFSTPGFEFEDGRMRVLAVPGCGLGLPKDVLSRGVEVSWQVS
ncbi:MAG: mandelate racemase/muconate lactonizing enzyme family protein [Planctomycetota bacterium]|nr:mandelate racemase/muconate lactonizing enzyme family protein [Planctomycetota bacterium]